MASLTIAAVSPYPSIVSVMGQSLSRYGIAKRIGVSQATLSRFMNGTRRLSMEVTDRVFALLGLSIARPRKTREGE